MNEDLKQWLKALIEEECNPKPVEIAPRWHGGTVTLKPGNDTQPKDIPIDVFFKKIIGIRESLRVLEQKINNHDGIPAEDRVAFQGYITKCYGSLTTFNVLFKHDKDKFVGAGSGGGGGSDPKEKLTYHEAKKRLGLREHGE